MKRRTLLFAIAIAALQLAGPAAAASLVDRVVAQLRHQGYSNIEVSRTWLGRARIVATSSANRREIIVNPRTGEILRDYWEDRSNATGGALFDPEDDGDDDEDDDHSGHGGGDDDDDDNSGPGSDNSGHGGGDDDD